MLVPAHLITTNNQLLSHLYFNFNNLDENGYPSVNQSARYYGYSSAPKLIRTSYSSATVAITKEGTLYDLFKRKILDVPILQGKRITKVFDIGRDRDFDFAILDNAGRLIEVKNFRYANATYTIVAEGVNCVVPNNQESTRYIFLNSDGQWVSKLAHVEGTAPLMGEVFPKLSEINSVRSGFVIARDGIYAVNQSSDPEQVHFSKFKGSKGFAAVGQYTSTYSNRRRNVVMILTATGKLFSNRIEGPYPNVKDWRLNTHKVKFIKLIEVGRHIIVVDANRDTYIVDRESDRLVKFPGLNSKM